jgi:arylsulfatase A-like enzyme
MNPSRWLWILMATAWCSRAAAAESATTTAAASPNIVIILADDLGFGDVACLDPGHARIPPPHLDALARAGVSFTDAHSGSSVCTPTRYGLLTGRYAWRTRLDRGVLSEASCEPLIAADRLTLPALLRDHGHATACIGKWHLGFHLDGKGVGARTPDGPLTRGFDTFTGFTHAREMEWLFEDDRVAQEIKPVEMLPLLAERAAGFVAQQAAAGKPFFLYLALNSPHTPIVPGPAWRGTSGLGDYADFVMQTDAAVGQVLAAIDRAGVAGDTFVLFTSDNGCSPQAKPAALAKRGHRVSGPYRGLKSDIWDGGHRVPCLARFPGRVAPGTTCRRLICLTDVMPTVAALVGADLPAEAAEDGVSFLPSLQGEPQPPRPPVVHHSIEGRFAIRDGRWKLCLCPGSGGWSDPEDAKARQVGLPVVQLYDLAADISEELNLAAAEPDTVARLTAVLKGFVSEGRSTPGPRRRNDREIAID